MHIRNGVLMTFRQAISTCFAKYADGNGRATLSEFCYFSPFYLIVWGSLWALQQKMIYWIDLIDIFDIPALTLPIAQIALIVPLIAVAVRRMHDVDKSGWFVLIPIYNLVLLATPGTVGPNRFGPTSVDLENGAQSTSDEQALRGNQNETTYQDLSASDVRPKKRANLYLVGLIMLGVSPLVAFSPFILSGIGSQLFCEACWAAMPWLAILTIPAGLLLAIGGYVMMFVGVVVGVARKPIGVRVG